MFKPLDQGSIHFMPDGAVIEMQVGVNHTKELPYPRSLALALLRSEIEEFPLSKWSVTLVSNFRSGAPDRSDPLGQRAPAIPTLTANIMRYKGARGQWFVQYDEDSYREMQSADALFTAIETYYARWMIEGVHERDTPA